MKVESMMKDLKVSEQCLQEYRMIKKDEEGPIETNFYVLTSGSWPITTSLIASLPPEVFFPMLLTHRLIPSRNHSNSFI